MAWVVDTCVLLDIGLNDPQFGLNSARLLDEKQEEGLTVSPVTFVELSPAFGGDSGHIEKFLLGLEIDFREEWTLEDTRAAASAWAAYVKKRRARQASKRPVADVMIGGFAMRFDGLLTRNSRDFALLFPGMKLIEPEA
jgi:predicted nucleic acid-binding protein